MKEYKIEIYEEETNGKGSNCWLSLGGKKRERMIYSHIMSEQEVDIRKVMQTIVEKAHVQSAKVESK